MAVLDIATRKGLFRLHRAGADWVPEGPPAFLGEPVTALLTDPRDGTRYAALRLGHFGCRLHRSTDGGTSWQEIVAPAYPASAEADAPALDMIWEIVPGGPDQPGTIWAGTLPGGLFVSRDRGESWDLVTSLWEKPERARWFGGGYDHPGIHSILVDPRDSRRMTLGISCGGVWMSEDGGETWMQGGQGLRADFLPPDQATDPVSQDPHRLAACTADPDRVWCQHHNGIFVSSDRGASFVEVKGVQPAHFGFAVAAHPVDAGTAWFVPGVKDECRVPVDGRLVVTRTRDGAGSFESLGLGLPDRPSYDLVYRHALAVDGSGDLLAMGSTTGNLWLSETGGDGWQLVTAHLPPVYAVAFA